MTNESDEELISPCGLYCGGCVLYLARTDAELRRKIAESRGITEDKLVTCAGCRPQKGKVPHSPDSACANYACATSKKIQFCYECPDFPCLKLAPCSDRASELPHNTKIYNLLLIKKEGTDAFIKNYRTRFRQYFKGKKPNPGGDIRE